MVYKLISEWRGVKGLEEHEIIVYKYNINHSEMIRYFKSPDTFYKEHYNCFDPTKTEHLDLTEEEKALVKIG